MLHFFSTKTISDDFVLVNYYVINFFCLILFLILVLSANIFDALFYEFINITDLCKALRTCQWSLLFFISNCFYCRFNFFAHPSFILLIFNNIEQCLLILSWTKLIFLMFWIIFGLHKNFFRTAHFLALRIILCFCLLAVHLLVLILILIRKKCWVKDWFLALCIEIFFDSAIIKFYSNFLK